MAQKNRALIVFGSLVVIGSIGYYLWSKSKKSEGEGSSEPTPDDKPIVGKGTTEPPKPIGEKKQIELPAYINSVERVKEFQDYLDYAFPKWLKGKKLNQGSGYGTFGPSTKSAWNLYGKDFERWEKSIKSQTDATQKQNQLNAIKSKFPKGKSVLANITFRAIANVFRNGGWYKTDINGNKLPSKEFLATAQLGKVVEVLNDGNVVVQLTTPIQGGNLLFSTNYWYIQGPSYWFK